MSRLMERPVRRGQADKLPLAGPELAYARELMRDKDVLAKLCLNVSGNSNIQAFLTQESSLKFAAKTIIIKLFYDIAYPHDKSDRLEAVEIGSLGILFTDIIDDEVDSAPLSNADKRRYLDLLADDLLGGATECDPAHSTGIKSAYALNNYLLSRLGEHPEGYERFAEVARPLVAAVGERIESTDVARQFELTQIVGGKCGEIAVAVIEAVTETPLPRLRDIAYSVGAYAQCLDDAYEIEKDLEEGSLTFPTTYLARYGDTPANRRKVKRALLREAKAVYCRKFSHLTSEEAEIYRCARRLMDVKYRVFDKLKS